MKVVADSSALLDFLDGVIPDPFKVIEPYRMIVISPVAFHEVLRTYPLEEHATLSQIMSRELLPPPTLDHWIESARILRFLYPKRQKNSVARMQNDILIALAARDLKAPIWTFDSDFALICDYMKVALLSKR